jgi:hypothetical protein
MSGEVRLDAATLEWVAEQLTTLRRAYAMVGGGDPCNALDGARHDVSPADLRAALEALASEVPK